MKQVFTALMILVSTAAFANQDNVDAQKTIDKQTRAISAQTKTLIQLAKQAAKKGDTLILPKPELFIASLSSSLRTYPHSVSDVCASAEALTDIGGSAGLLDAQDCQIRMNQERLKQLSALKTKLKCNVTNCQAPEVDKKMSEAFYTYAQ